jgi:dynein heavy chain, axonemal
MNEHYEKVFDAIAHVTHSKSDRTVIERFNAQGAGAESIRFSTPVRAQGNIEDWLCDLLARMQLSVKDLTRTCAADIANVSGDISGLRHFVDR